MKKEATVEGYISQREIITPNMRSISYHNNLLKIKIEKLKTHFPELNDFNEDEMLVFLLELFRKCDYEDPMYDQKIDEEITRIGLYLDILHHDVNRNIWNNGMFYDDGFGTRPTDIYDDFIDSEYDRAARNIK